MGARDDALSRELRGAPLGSPHTFDFVTTLQKATTAVVRGPFDAPSGRALELLRQVRMLRREELSRLTGLSSAAVARVVGACSTRVFCVSCASSHPVVVRDVRPCPSRHG